MIRKYLTRAACAGAVGLAALPASAGGEFIHALVKAVYPHELTVPAPTVKIAGPVAAARIATGSDLMNQGQYSLAILEAEGEWEAAAYLRTEIREFVNELESTEGAPDAGSVALPEHAKAVVYPTQLVKELPLSDELKAALMICVVKAPSWSVSTDPRIRAIGKEFARQCGMDRG